MKFKLSNIFSQSLLLTLHFYTVVKALYNHFMFVL